MVWREYAGCKTWLSPLVSWCRWHDWPPLLQEQGQLSKRKTYTSHTLQARFQFHWHHHVYTFVKQNPWFTLCVFVINWVLRQVFQIVWNKKSESTLQANRWKLLRTLGHKCSVLCSKFLECNLKLKSRMKRSTGAYIMHLYISDVSYMPQVLALSDRPRWHCKPNSC